MRIIDTTNKLCLCCMEIHDVKLVEVEETTTFKGMPVKHIARYEYCDVADEYLSESELIAFNDIAMKNAYRKANHLLTTEEIVGIRNKYEISQKDLANVLGWGEKTITRYEGHQVQDAAHDFVLRKINEDPMCFFECVEQRKDTISEELYNKYKEAMEKMYKQLQDAYLRKAIEAEYLRYQNYPIYYGGSVLDLDKVVAVINYFANSPDVSSLYKVKLMKLLWYADFLSYKRNGHSMTGLVYKALPMGAVPTGYKSIVNLQGIKCEEVVFGQGSGTRFERNDEANFNALNENDIEILDSVIVRFGKLQTAQIVKKMHEEKAYKETAAGQVIEYKYAKYLSVE